jgi:hypothetical protein
VKRLPPSAGRPPLKPAPAGLGRPRGWPAPARPRRLALAEASGRTARIAHLLVRPPRPAVLHAIRTIRASPTPPLPAPAAAIALPEQVHDHRRSCEASPAPAAGRERIGLERSRVGVVAPQLVGRGLRSSRDQPVGVGRATPVAPARSSRFLDHPSCVRSGR